MYYIFPLSLCNVLEVKARRKKRRRKKRRKKRRGRG